MQKPLHPFPIHHLLLKLIHCLSSYLAVEANFLVKFLNINETSLHGRDGNDYLQRPSLIFFFFLLRDI